MNRTARWWLTLLPLVTLTIITYLAFAAYWILYLVYSLFEWVHDFCLKVHNLVEWTNQN